jgi:hypothetical protein
MNESRKKDVGAEKLAEERVEEYQSQVGKLQRLMEERSMVAEGKIKTLQTENEALRLHLKLALDTLKNPIPEVPSAKTSTSPAFTTDQEGDKENRELADDEQGDHAGHVYEDDEHDEFEEHDERAKDMQDHMQDLLKDLGMYRRKIGDDKSRFLQPLAERMNR